MSTITSERKVNTNIILPFFLICILSGIIIGLGVFNFDNPDNNAIIFTSILLLVASIFQLISYKRDHNLLSPVSLMAFAWIPTILLHDLQLSPAYLVKLDLKTWLVILYSFSSFCFSALVASRIVGIKIGTDIAEIFRKRYNPTNFRRAIYVIFGIGFIVSVYNVIMRGGIYGLPFFVGVTAKWNYLLPIIGQFILLMDVATIWALLYLNVFGFKNSHWLVLIIILVVLREFLFLTRSTLFFLILLGMSMIYLFKRKYLSKRLVIIVSISIFLIFQGVGSIIGVMDRSKALVESGKINVPFYSLAYPYVYLTTAITNLQLNMHHAIAFSHGLRTFGPLLSIIQLIQYSSFPDYVSYWGGGIVPYQGSLYLDFGFLGVIIGPIILGSLSGWLYKKSLIASNLLAIILYSIMAASIVTSSITNWFTLGRTWNIALASIGFFVFVDISSKIRSKDLKTTTE